MKKILFCSIIILITSVFNISAQDKKSIINLGVGALYGVGGSISYDYRIKNFNDRFALTVGGYIGVQRGDGYSMMGGDKIYFWDYKSLISPRVGCVYSLSRHFDIYAALMPGFMEDVKYEKPKKSYFFTGITAGLRVKLFNDVYLFTEEGYNILCLNAGLAFKF